MKLPRFLLGAIAMLGVGFTASSCMGTVGALGGGGQKAQATQATQDRIQPAAAAFSIGLSERTLSAGGRKRSYQLYVPRQARKAPAGLVIAFHGGGQNVRRFSEGVDIQRMADRYGFVVALPQGIKNTWNAGGNPPAGYAEVNRIDDLGFVTALLDELTASGRIDPAKVYAMGVSKGGMMAYWAACNMPERLAAIAVVAGTLSAPACPRFDDTSLLHIHGENDQNVPFHGGRGAYTAKGSYWPSAFEGIQKFRQAESCAAEESVSRVAPDTTCRASRCSGGDTVQYCLVDDGGHAWPGGDSSKRHKKRGIYVSPYFDATSYIAEFFLAN